MSNPLNIDFAKIIERANMRTDSLRCLNDHIHGKIDGAHEGMILARRFYENLLSFWDELDAEGQSMLPNEVQQLCKIANTQHAHIMGILGTTGGQYEAWGLTHLKQFGEAMTKGTIPDQPVADWSAATEYKPGDRLMISAKVLDRRPTLPGTVTVEGIYTILVAIKDKRSPAAIMAELHSAISHGNVSATVEVTACAEGTSDWRWIRFTRDLSHDADYITNRMKDSRFVMTAQQAACYQLAEELASFADDEFTRALCEALNKGEVTFDPT